MTWSWRNFRLRKANSGLESGFREAFKRGLSRSDVVKFQESQFLKLPKDRGVLSEPGVLAAYGALERAAGGKPRVVAIRQPLDRLRHGTGRTGRVSAGECRPPRPNPITPGAGAL